MIKSSSTFAMENLKPYRLEQVPDTIYYIPEFITTKKERFLQSQVYSVPNTKWTQLSCRRLQNWGGQPHPKGMIVEKLPLWLKDCSDMLQEFAPFGVNKPNHVLVNEYITGQGIMPHTDGPLYYPTVATISLGGHTVLDFYKPIDSQERSNRYQFSLLLEPRSLILLKNEMYTKYLHGIEQTTEDCFSHKQIKNKTLLGDPNLIENLQNPEFLLPRSTTRISLTIRYVPKTFLFNFRN